MQKKVQAAINRVVASVHVVEPTQQDVYCVCTFDPEDSIRAGAAQSTTPRRPA